MNASHTFVWLVPCSARPLSRASDSLLSSSLNGTDNASWSHTAMPSPATYAILWPILGLMTLLYAIVFIDYFLHKTQIMAHVADAVLLYQQKSKRREMLVQTVGDLQPLTEQELRPGLRVGRGLRWKHDDEDGGPGGRGTVLGYRLRNNEVGALPAHPSATPDVLRKVSAGTVLVQWDTAESAESVYIYPYKHLGVAPQEETPEAQLNVNTAPTHEQIQSSLNRMASARNRMAAVYD